MADGDRFVVLGVARPRLVWPAEVTGWANSGILGIDFVKALSLADARAQLRSGRVFSAVLADGGLPGVDRDLLDVAHRCGACVVVVDDGRRDWPALGASVVLPATFGPHDLATELERHATMVPRATDVPGVEPAPPSVGFRAPLVAVVGPGGSGTSTMAMALAQGLAAHVGHTDTVVLADLCRNAEQALLHDAGDVFPGVSELVDAHRLGRPEPAQIRAITFEVPTRRYRLLLGLRQHRDWTALRRRAVAEALDSLRRSFTMVVADVDDDLENEGATGSVDIDDRNRLTTAAISVADAVVVTGIPGAKGLHSHLRVLRAVLDHGVGPERVIPVLNRVGRGRGPRSEAAQTHVGLRDGTAAAAVVSPILLADRSDLDTAIRDVRPLPVALSAVVADAVLGRLEHVAPRAGGASEEPEPVAAGSLGTGPLGAGGWPR